MDKNKKLGKKFALRSCFIFKQEIKFKRAIEDWQLADDLKDEEELISAFEKYLIALCTKSCLKGYREVVVDDSEPEFCRFVCYAKKNGLKVHDYVEEVIKKFCDKYGFIYGRVHDCKIVDEANTFFEISFPALSN